MKTDSYYEVKSPSYGISGGRLRHILDLVPSEPATVLDVGCAGGELAKVLHGLGHRVWGIESSGQALETAKKYLKEGYHLDVTDPAWPNDLLNRRFDVIIASELIEHLFDPEPVVRRLRGLLAPGGRLIVTTPNFLFWKNRLSMLLGRFRYEKEGLLDFGHIRFFTLATARELFQRAGLRIEREHHYYPNLEHRGLGTLGRFFPGFFAYQLIFQAVKNEN